MRQRTQRSARERTELRKRRQIHTLAELSLTYILLQIRPFLCFQKVKCTAPIGYKTGIFLCCFTQQKFLKVCFAFFKNSFSRTHFNLLKHFKSDVYFCANSETLLTNTYKHKWQGGEGARFMRCAAHREGFLPIQETSCWVSSCF